MNYQQIKTNLNKLPVFFTSDLIKIDKDFHLQRLSEWQKKKEIKKIKRGLYIFSDKDIDEYYLFLIANVMLQPSYVSLNSALSIYNIIPETVFEISSVTSRKTSYYKTEFARFNYRSIKPSLLFGYKLVERNGFVYKIASLEKTVLDYLYFNKKADSIDYFEEYRFNKEMLNSQLDIDKFKRYLKAFNNNSLKKRANTFLEYIQND